MANISDAYGKVTIKTDANIKNFVKTLNDITSVWEYGIYFAEDGEQTSENEYIYSFGAAGRWSFHCSLENLGRWLEEDEDSQLLIENDWSMTFDFLDVEGGNGVLYTEEAVLEHEANEPLSNSKFYVINEEIFDWNFCSYYNAMDSFDGYSTCPEDLMETAKGEFLDWRDEEERGEEIVKIIDKMKRTKPFCDNLEYFKDLLVA